jgi:inorganic pyrophosphatase
MANLPISPQRLMPNLLHTLPAWVDEEKGILNGLIETNEYSINKYEFITETGHMKLDRVGYSSLVYPVGYGLIPKTWDLDNDMLDFVVANVTEPLLVGSLAELRVIGIIKFVDKGEQDDKLITVLSDDLRMSHITSYTDLGSHWEKETQHFLEHYKDLKKPGTCTVQGFFGVDKARTVINECIERYTTDYLPKFEN